MTTCMGKSCSFGLLCVSLVNAYKILCVSFFPCLYGGWYVSVLSPYHCLSIYFQSYQDDGRVLMKGCAQIKPVYD